MVARDQHLRLGRVYIFEQIEDYQREAEKVECRGVWGCEDGKIVYYIKIGELDALEVSSRWNGSLHQQRFEVKSKIKEILLKDERALRMKSKFTQAKEGDANSKLFHRLMNARTSKNSITRLEQEYGSFAEGEDDIVKDVIE